MNLLWSLRHRWDNMTQAFVKFILHKSVTWYRLPDTEYRPYRYPAPGSETIDHRENLMDYKTAYRDSVHSIRYGKETKLWDKSYNFIRDPFGETIEEKLMRFGCLKKKDKFEPKEIEDAKKKYEEKVGEKVDVIVHHDDFDVSQKMNLLKDNRDAMAQYIRQMFITTKEQNASEAFLDCVDDNYRPKFFFFRNLDYSADDPVFRQTKLELEFYMQHNADLRKEKGEMRMFKGDPNFWLILDNSFQPESIKQIQATVKDTVSTLDQGFLEKNHKTIHFHKEEIVKLPIKTNFI